MIYIKFVPDIKFSRLSISLSIGLFNMKTFIFRYHIKILNLDIGNDIVKLTILFDKNY
jgi:hypothetical protein